MALEFSGTVKKIGEVQQISPTFAKRELVVLMDGQYPQFIAVDFAQSRMELLDKVKEGEYVRVYFDLRGREWIDPKTNQARYFNSLSGWKIEPATPGMAAPVSAFGAANPFNAQPSGETSASEPAAASDVEPDDLPF